MNSKFVQVVFVLFSTLALIYLAASLLIMGNVEIQIIDSIAKYAELPSVFLGLFYLAANATEDIVTEHKIKAIAIWLLAFCALAAFVVLKHGSYLFQLFNEII